MLQPGALIGGRYEIQRYLAEGGMQYVFIANDTETGRVVALKTPKNKSAEKRFQRSAIVAAKVNHPNVAKTLDYLVFEERQFLVEELILGQDMRAALLNDSAFIDPYLAAKVFHHLAKGVAAAHHVGVVHRDLKPTNIMVVGDYSLTELKVTDFGIAKMAAEEIVAAVEGGEESLTTSQTAVGALPYMAPEAIETPRSVGTPADIWSLGAMMFHLLTGDYPFGQGLNAVPKIISAIQPQSPGFLFSNPQFSPLARELIKIASACMSKDPNSRPTADQLVESFSGLCYSVAIRSRGTVESFVFNSYGYISSQSGRVFFHRECVYGALPKVGENVLFSSYDGGGAPRALPVVKLK
ncbi:serine/threonine-protein kinase [Ectopseudomonas khazarica]|uniref:serine/threonine-protein kinase n=1 Tax=Ectopseudomonas khazarica TaxID=2502979 RepID=UPI00106EE79A|nr:serine/threonine-protein kinase [Pseudomonas khazarica]